MKRVFIEELNDVVYGGPYTVHPAAELFPLVEGQEFDRLVESIREHGIQNPVVFGFDVQEKPVLLDGRNRLRAVERLKADGITVPVPTLTFDYSDDGITQVEWIEAQNIDRRHLTDDARAMLAASLHEMIEAEATAAQKESQFNAKTAKAAAEKRHHQSATADSASPQKRDRRKSEARTTAAKIAAKGKVTRHKAKQALAAVKAAKAGTISPDVPKEVIAGKKKLKDAVPAKGRTKATAAKPRKYESVEDEIRVVMNHAWSRLKEKIAVSDHKLLRRMMLELVRGEQKHFDK